MDYYRVETEKGPVCGVRQNDSVVFKGIPYAAPPVGDLRFAAPKEHEKWLEPIMCDNWPPDAFRIPGKSFIDHKEVYAEEHCYSEDCLYLNIWVPEQASEGDSLPVMLWLYGAGGSSHDTAIDGRAYNKNGCILISINYRIGIFGFFGCREFAERDQHHSSGNYGLMDILFAMKWVKNNISKFGGDSDNITVFGHSAGAMFTKWLVGCKQATGLFNRIISLSGGGIWDIDYIHTLDGKCCYVDRLLKLAGWTAEDMMTRPADEIYQTLLPLEQKIGLPNKSMLNTLFLPSMDGWLVNDYYGKILYDGKVNREVDVMCGMLIEEWHNVPCQIPGGIGDYHREFALGPVISWAKRYSELGLRPVYTYFFERSMPGDDGRSMIHGDELPYVFSTMERYSWPWTEFDYEMSRAVVKYFTNFAKTGNPNGEELPRWNAYTEEKPVTMHFTEGSIKSEDISSDPRTQNVVRFLLEHPGMLDDPFPYSRAE